MQSMLWRRRKQGKGIGRVWRIQLTLRKDLKEVRELAREVSRGRVFLAEGTACGEALRRPTCYVHSTMMRPL